MAEDSTKRRRKKTEPERINLDEWAHDGALDGLLSFLTISPERAPINQGSTKVLDLLQNRGPDRSPGAGGQGPGDAKPSITGTVPVPEPVPDIDENVPPRRPPTLSISGTPSITGPVPVPDRQSPIPNPQPLIPSTWSETGTPSITATVPVIDRPAPGPRPLAPEQWHPKQATGFGNKKLYRCTLAQDGHSHTEEALYQILWRTGKPETEDSRLAVMGYGEMAGRVRLSFNNTKSACQRLIAKMSIEEIAREISDKRVGKTYRVYSYRAILERRKARGMEWVIRNKGVEFVTPQAAPIPSITDTVPFIDAVPATGRGTRSIQGRGTGSITGPLLENSFRAISREESSSFAAARASLVQALSDYGQPDDDVAHALLLRCRQVVADCSVSEIVHFIHQKGTLVRQDRAGRIASPMGFLLTAVPKCFAGETFERYREQERRRLEEERAIRERQQAEIDEWRREQEAVLADPEASGEDKRLAREILGLD